MGGDITVELRVLNYAPCAQCHLVRHFSLARLVGAGMLLHLWGQRASQNLNASSRLSHEFARVLPLRLSHAASTGFAHSISMWYRTRYVACGMLSLMVPAIGGCTYALPSYSKIYEPEVHCRNHQAPTITSMSE